jgi:hypothetical protein
MRQDKAEIGMECKSGSVYWEHRMAGLMISDIAVSGPRAGKSVTGVTLCDVGELWFVCARGHPHFEFDFR